MMKRSQAAAFASSVLPLQDVKLIKIESPEDSNEESQLKEFNENDIMEAICECLSTEEPNEDLNDDRGAVDSFDVKRFELAKQSFL